MVLERFESEEVRVRRLRASPGYHSALIEPALDGLQAAFADVAVSPPSLAMVSNLTGRAMGPDELDGVYWRRQAREPVAFRRCVEIAGGDGGGRSYRDGPARGVWDL